MGWLQNNMINNKFVKFLIVGCVNTLVSYLMFLALLYVVNYDIAYAISYGVGILVSYFLNGKWTFKKSITFKGVLTYPLVYIVQFSTGWLVLKYGIETLSLTENQAYILSIIISIPIGFLASKLYFKAFDKI